MHNLYTDIKEIFIQQVKMVYSLFQDNFGIPSHVVRDIFQHELEKCRFYFPDEQVVDCIKDHRVSMVESDENKIVLNAKVVPLTKEESFVFDMLSDEAKEATYNRTMEVVWSTSFGRRANRWDLDLSTKAILLNTDNLIHVCLTLYDVYKQIRFNDDQQTLPVLRVGGFPTIKEDAFSYSLFTNTICRYLQNIYVAYDLDVYVVWVINCCGGIDKFRLMSTIRSMRDQTGFENANIPEDIFPAVFPNFHCT